jgi:PAS domain S-box-containing protein
MKHCPLPAIVRDGSGRLIFVNDNAKQVFGLDTDWKKRTLFDLLEEENAERLRRQDQTVLARLEPAESIIVLKNVEGDRHWLNRSFPLPGPGGETLVGGWAFDVTEHHALVKVLRDSEERYRTMLEQSRELIVSVAKDGRFVFVNRAWQETLGYSVEESRKLTIFDVVEEGLRQELRAMLSRAQTGTATADLETTLLADDGRKIAVRGSLLPYFVDKDAVVTQAFFSNVTEEERAKNKATRLQEAVRRAANDWTRTVDAVQSAIIVVGLDGRVRRLNRRAAELAGRDFKDSLGRRVDELGRGEPWRTAHTLIQIVGDPTRSKTRRMRDEQTQRHWEVSLNLTSHTVPDRMIIIVARDITETVELQESLRRSELMSSLGSLVASVAHEVRNPLFSISAVLDAFEARFREKIDFGDYVDRLRMDIGRLSVLMEDLIDYGKPPTLDLKDLPFGKVVSSAVRQTSHLAESKEVILVQEIAEADLSLYMDQVRLTQLLTNLVENAIQHSPAGGRVTVTAEPIRKNDGPWIECKVLDAGPGFEVSILNKIFEPFFSRRRGGTGLGLSIVHRIVEDHGGEVFAGNREEGGGVVTVRLPRLGVETEECSLHE